MSVTKSRGALRRASHPRRRRPTARRPRRVLFMRWPRGPCKVAAPHLAESNQGSGVQRVVKPCTMRAQRQHERRDEHERAVDDVQRVDDELLVAEHRQRAERDLHGDEQSPAGGSPDARSSRAAAMVKEDVTAGRRADQQRHDRRADAMREVNRNLRVPVRRNQVAEREREVRNRQPRSRMPHRRANAGSARRSRWW